MDIRKEERVGMTQTAGKRNILFIATMILMSVYLGWRILFTLPIHDGLANLLVGIWLVTAELVTVLTTFELFYQKMKTDGHRLECPVIPADCYPDVDVFIATHNEPTELLYKTANACTFMDYPDKSKVHIYLCDDGNRRAVAELARQLHIGYLGLAGNRDAKSGNLNHALSRTHSPLIATFDADMIPQHTFLMKTVPYFLLPRFIKEGGVWRPRRKEEIDASYKIGLIQTPQSFYNPDLFQFNLYAERRIPNEQDFFSKEVNILRNASNAVAYTGSNTVIAREAMEEIGGFPLKTITEDFETSIRIQQAGYITYATEEVQAAGLTTTTVPSMLKQRTRWARGIIQSLQNTHAVFSRRLSRSARITYLNIFLYWWSFFNRLIFILAPILFALFGFRLVDTGFWEIVGFWLPAYFCYGISMRYLSGNIRNQRWSQVIDTILMPYLIFPVLLETLHIHQKTFHVTSKKSGSGSAGSRSLLFALPDALLLILSVTALVRFVAGKYGWALFYSSIILFWLTYNMVALCYALFFMLGRQVYRDSERIRAEETVWIQYNGLDYQGRTEDVSESGMSVLLGQPIYVPEFSSVRLRVKSSRYEAQLHGKLVYARRQKDGWRYALTVQPVGEADKRQYMQIIYDRPHSLPKQMDLWNTAYDDMVRNVRRRLAHPFADRRKMPRIPLDRPVTFTNGASGVLRDFNYRYFAVADLRQNGGGEGPYVFVSPSGIQVVLQDTGSLAAKKQGELFRVVNLDELAQENLMGRLLEDLTGVEETRARVKIS